jgi:hypothetical protein
LSQTNANGKRQFNVQLQPKRKVENLPRTGIEYPIMKQTTQFISQHKEFEPLNTKPCSQSLIDEYILHDAERANLSACKSSFSSFVIRFLLMPNL